MFYIFISDIFKGTVLNKNNDYLLKKKIKNKSPNEHRVL